MKDKFEHIENNMLLAVATILDPRFKRKFFQSAISSTRASNFIEKEILLDLETENARLSVLTESSTSQTVLLTPLKGLWKSHDEELQNYQGQAVDDLQRAAHTELYAYLSQQLYARKENPFIAWESMRYLFPHLYVLARKFLAVSATSVPTERLFSLAGRILDEYGSRLSPAHLHQRIVMATVNDDLWFSS